MAARKKRRLGMGLSGMIGTPVEVRSAPTAPADSPPVQTVILGASEIPSGSQVSYAIDPGDVVVLTD